MSDIRSWLQEQGFGKFAEAFVDNEFEVGDLVFLAEDDLEKLGMPMGPRKRLLAVIAREAAAVQGASGGEVVPTTPEPEEVSRSGTAERRQMTVMFCDLVGSVDLGERMDAEDYRDLLGRFREEATRTIEAHAGFIARHQGDGLLAYFGYPQAQENDAERSVRAGLDLVHAVKRLRPPFETPIRVRVGLATGPSIVGDLLSTGHSPEVAALGSTPNLAARLQGSAQPNTVLVSALTERLVRRRFACERLELVLKGFATPVTAFLVERELASGVRPMAQDSALLTPFVGRREEMALLEARWLRAREGEGQVVLLSGEPGVGKSRLVREYLDTAGEEARRLLVLHGSQYHQGSPLHPLVAQLEQSLAIPDDSPADSRRRIVDAWLSAHDLDPETLGPWFVALLAPRDESDIDPAVRKRNIHHALLTWLVEGQSSPALIVVEDAHWLDPSTMELLGELVEHIRDRRLLLIVTHRSEFIVPWGDPGHQTAIALKGLSRKEVISLTTLAAGDSALPAATVRAIVERADGLPLFAEELARSVIEDGEISGSGGVSSPSTAVPGTLRDSLMARLDRLGPAKRVAQAASVVGRGFTATRLARTLGADAQELHGQLTRLVRSGLVLKDRGQGEDAYVFKHALVCDAAYESMLKDQRRDLHGRLAAALASEPGQVRQFEPEYLAHHLAEAGLHEAALQHFLAAGKRAAEQAAYTEAVGHLTRGLALIENLPRDPSFAQREVELRVALGVPLMKGRSVASDEVGENYRRARELCEEFGLSEAQFPVLWGQWYHHMLRFDVRQACEFADELLVTGKNLEDDALELEAHHCQWASRFLTGDLEATLRHADEGLGLYSPAAHHPLMFIYGGHDPGVCAHDVGALTLWLSGSVQQALERIETALALAHALGQPSTLANTVSKALTLAGFRRDLDDMALLGEQLRTYLQGDIAEQSRPHADAALGWVSYQRGKREVGLAQMRAAVGSGLMDDPWNIYLTTLIADALGRDGAVDEGLCLVEEALELSEGNNVHWWTPELFRAKGELLELQGAGNTGAAGAWFERALATARSRKATSLSLRAAVSLARHLEARNRRSDARGLLLAELEGFDANLDSIDLAQARGLLESCR